MASNPHGIRSSQGSLHKQALWLYGVLVGLSIGEALRSAIPHIISIPPPAGIAYGRWSDLIRLVVFLTVIIRFYLGAAAFFDEEYIKRVEAKYPQKSFGTDFLIGIIHFILFFALASTIDVHPKVSTDPSAFTATIASVVTSVSTGAAIPAPSVSAIPLRLFPVILGFILIYDLLWYFVCREYDTRRFIKRWMIVNCATFLIGLLTYTSIYWGLFPLQLDPARRSLCAEAGAFVWVLLVSGIDLDEIVRDKKYFRQLLAGILPEEEV